VTYVLIEYQKQFPVQWNAIHE